MVLAKEGEQRPRRCIVENFPKLTGNTDMVCFCWLGLHRFGQTGLNFGRCWNRIISFSRRETGRTSPECTTEIILVRLDYSKNWKWEGV